MRSRLVPNSAPRASVRIFSAFGWDRTPHPFRIIAHLRAFVYFLGGGRSIPVAQQSPEAIGAGFRLLFALKNSSRFRLRRTAHCADASLVCLLSYGCKALKSISFRDIFVNSKWRKTEVGQAWGNVPIPSATVSLQGASSRTTPGDMLPMSRRSESDKSTRR